MNEVIRKNGDVEKVGEGREAKELTPVFIGDRTGSITSTGGNLGGPLRNKVKKRRR